MKKALILSLGLAVLVGLSGCTAGDKIKDATDTVKETVEKPVMVLGDDAKDAMEIVVDGTEDMANKAGNAMDDTKSAMESDKKMMEEEATK